MVKNVRMVGNWTLFSVLILLGACIGIRPAHADRYSSPSYTIDASTLNTFGNSGTSSNYQLTSSGGEAIIGNGSGGSYKLGQGYVAQLEQSMRLHVQPNGLTAYYPLDEGSGTRITDSSANSYDGETVSAPAWGTGKLGQGMVFTGDAGAKYAKVADNAAISPTANGTFMFWVNIPDVSTTTGVTKGILVKLQHTGFDNPPYEIIASNSRIYFRTTTTGNVTREIFTSAVLTSGNWFHVAGTIDTSTGKQVIYINGLESVSDTFPAVALYDSTGELRIGRQKDGFSNRYLDGTVDHLKIFNRTLSDKEIKAEYDAQNAGRTSGLSLGTVIGGVSNTANFDAITQASTTSYSLAISQNGDLDNGTTTIPAVSGSIASPVAWSEGSTKGLGFTLVSGSGIPGSWNSGNSYAALPGSATTFYTRTGYTVGAKDVLGMRLRLDTTTTQAAGDYTNIMTITGTTIP